MAHVPFDVHDAFKGPYAARIAEFTQAGKEAGLILANEDTEKIALVLVDYQHDFVDPSGTLYVPGSQEDVARFLTMEGTLGHMLVAPISEAIAWHSAARKAQPTYIVKGQTIRTEYYGIFGAEIPDPQDPTSALNERLLDAVLKHDKVYVTGEAKSHCVLETERQLLEYSGNTSGMVKKLHFLRDCTSSVQHPTIDFDALTESELKEMEKKGVKMVFITQ